MVDNENQWENTEYLGNDENLNSSYDEYAPEKSDYENSEYQEEYKDQQYSDNYDENQNYENLDEQYDDFSDEPDTQPKKRNPLVLILLLIILACAGVFALMAKSGNTNTVANQPKEKTIESESISTEEVGDFFFSEAGGDSAEMMSVNFDEEGNTTVPAEEGSGPQEGEQMVAKVSDAPEGSLDAGDDLFAHVNSQDDEGSAIMISYAPAVRSNPFKPPVVTKKEVTPVAKLGNVEFEIIEPPVAAVEDSNITKLLKTKISGIMYDDESPAAIVNLDGADYFVKVGDKVSGYQIDSITRDKVAIRYKNNSYVASVGELFSPGELTRKPAVSNLESKFGGRYKNNN